MTLKLHNSLSGKKETFTPLDAPRVRIYNCGITPHDVSHLGHGTAALRTAMARRYLQYLGYDVTFVQNVTDVDDKIIARSKALGQSVTEIAERYTAEFNGCLATLGVPAADHEPKVSEYIDAIIRYVEELIAKGAAYATKDGDVYFDVAKKSDYGKLSGRVVSELLAGSREITGGEKRGPADFALWKSDPTGPATWPSPWGKGRPGWHIECSVMSNHLLGAHFDIHCGGLDLIFPHHENELAQCEAHNDCPFANYWLHVGLLNVDGTKMSKSLGNFISLKQALDRYGVALLTFVTAKHHYRSPIDFCDRLFHETLNQLCEFHDLIGAPASAAQGRDTPLDADFQAEMDEDLNSPRAMQVLMTALREASARPPSERAQVAAKVRQLSEILGIYQPSQSAADVRAACLRFQTDFLKRPLLTVDSVEALLMQRTAARQRRDWKESDRIRDELLISGVTVCDSPTGATTWQFTVLPT